MPRWITPQESIPNDAEHLRLSDYMEHTMVPSKILDDTLVDGPVVFICPRCKYPQDEPEHGEPRSCPKCNLHMIAYGNNLSIWVSD